MNGMQPAAKKFAPWVALAKQGRSRMPNGGLKTAPERKPIARRTKARASEDRIYLRRRRAFLNKHRRCAVFNFPSNQVHHSRGRDGRLLLEERWWIPVSAEGHAWIDRCRNQARKILWNGIPILCAKGDWGRSETMP